MADLGLPTGYCMILTVLCFLLYHDSAKERVSGGDLSGISWKAFWISLVADCYMFEGPQDSPKFLTNQSAPIGCYYFVSLRQVLDSHFSSDRDNIRRGVCSSQGT